MPSKSGADLLRKPQTESNNYNGTRRDAIPHNAFGPSSHFNDLLSLQPDPDLIQLSSAGSTPQIRPADSDRNAGCLIDSDSIRLSRTISTRDQESHEGVASPNLLDQESPPSQSRTNLLEQQYISISVDNEELMNNATTNQRLCDQCETGGNLDYCNVCDGNFCDRCWKAQFSHKSKRLAPGSIPHERTSFDTAQKIKAVLEPEDSPEQKDKLHHEDEDTTWFGVVREDAELPLFQDYGRYARIMADTQGPSSSQDSGTHDQRYPSLVSFVGQTGAGKSTIIKLVVDLGTEDGDRFPTPVIGAAGEDVPTSADVHLYSDPQSSNTDNPILYADCEGLQGGERAPVAAKFRKPQKKAKYGRVGSFEKRLTEMHLTSEREITWANTNHKRSREFAVTHLYPRLLYTFSDVVVFVLKNPRVIESVFERLVDWAAAALEKSSNQPVLPHAVIVLNATEYDINPDLWTTRQATTQLLESMSKTVYQNATFKKYAQFWRERHRQIETIEQLLHAYYSSVRVVRIPTRGRPNLIREQIQRLQVGINSACEFARQRKAALRMLMNADELQPYLQYAFDHFASNLETPFDFVQASFTNSPVPHDFGGNMLKLALSMMEAWGQAIDGEIIFRELSYMVASCIMLDSARSKIRGVAEQIFPHYVEHVEAALENFCDRYWPCEYVKPGKTGARCVNVRSGHGSKGHQLKNGKVFAVGGYVSSFSFEEYQETFLADVYSRLFELLKILRSRVQEGGEYEAQAAAELHRDTVLVRFIKNASNGKRDALVSHITCYCCLFEPPEYALRCGHVICASCLLGYGRAKARNTVEIDGCPLESITGTRDQTCKFILKPSAAGIRILTLDGGGIRGIVELEALRQIERYMGGRLDVRSFFDLIVGTSTGGIIALGLAAKEWSVEECTEHFQSLCKEAFVRRTGGGIPGISWLVDNYNHSKYRTRPLQAALIEAFSDDVYLFGGPNSSKPYISSIKVAVTATSNTGSPVILANYNRFSAEKLPYHFQRPETLKSELKIWEAARATSAAPRIFKPFSHEPSKQILIDGAMYHNNPVNIADKERKLLWPNLKNEPPDIMVSIGTTYRSVREINSEPRPQSKSGLGVVSHTKSLIKIAVDHIASALDSEKTWDSYLGILQPASSHKDRYVRLNPQLDEDPPSLDDVDKLHYIKAIARAHFSEDGQIQHVAKKLIASSFYFESSGQKVLMTDGSIQCSGHIYSRFPSGSRELSEIGRFIKDKMMLRNGVYFVIQEEYRGRQATYTPITSDTIEQMIKDCQFIVKRIDLELSSKLATTEISLYLGSGEAYPISRFPRSLLQDDAPPPVSRKAALPNSQRWAGRTPSQSRLRKAWVPPDFAKASYRLDAITRYLQDDYIIGNSSTSRLHMIADRLAGRRRNISVPAIAEMASDDPHLPWEKSPVSDAMPPADTSGTFELPAANTSVVFENSAADTSEMFESSNAGTSVMFDPIYPVGYAELPGSIHAEHTELPDSTLAGLPGKHAERLLALVESSQSEATRRATDSEDEIGESQRGLKTLQQQSEESKLGAAEADIQRAKALSLQEARERHFLNLSQRRAEDAALAQAIEESQYPKEDPEDF